MRKRAQKTSSRPSRQWTIISTEQFIKSQTRPLLGLLAQRHHTTDRFVLRYTFDAPHRKEHRAQTDEWLLVNYRSNPFVKRVQVESAQEYSSGVDFVEYAPIFLARSVQDDKNWCALVNH